MMGSRGTSPATEQQQALGVLSDLLELLRPLISQPALAVQLADIVARETAVSAREEALLARETEIRAALAALRSSL
jgi:hypothetical protein